MGKRSRQGSKQRAVTAVSLKDAVTAAKEVLGSGAAGGALRRAVGGVHDLYTGDLGVVWP